ncbi:PAS domain-containing protein [Alicyclobacillus acidiphilus]|uniref:PAS domain-containing protein n=1 Tax=Alicyclobacillus acidiphilus TaxID=182455 RepID=UPI00082FA6C9|nr:PAS domain-containing protein [Alicyclobacillus acidiphilus]
MRDMTVEELWGCLSSTTDNILVILDDQLRVQFLNDAAKSALHIGEMDYVNQDYFDVMSTLILPNDRDATIISKVFTSGEPSAEFIRKSPDERYFSINAAPMKAGSNIIGVLIVGADITDYIHIQEELDRAFSLTLPDTKIEFKLKTTIEYQDEFNPDTQKIRITGRMLDGGYRHVVNCLRIFSILRSMGVTKVIGIDKTLMTQAFIFHDLGKTQPILQVGDEVDPALLFEDGKLHAARSAELARGYYDVEEDAVTLIKYHHHRETELPSDFPWRLIPAWRLFQLIDGISAAITRVGIAVELNVFDCVVQVNEINNPRPQYNGTRQIDLYSGQVTYGIDMLPGSVWVSGKCITKYTRGQMI